MFQLLFLGIVAVAGCTNESAEPANALDTGHEERGSPPVTIVTALPATAAESDQTRRAAESGTLAPLGSSGVPSYWSTPTTAINPQPTPANANFDALTRQMLDLVNQARVAEGQSPLAWDPIAAAAGRRHAADMVRLGYFSHRNPAGLGPDHRYTLAGGRHAVQENLHAFSYTYPDGSGAPIEDWEQVIADAHENLMSSPGHRENVLAPAHTHLGIGLAYNPKTGEFRLAQEFTKQYVRLEQPIPLVGRLGQIIPVQGSVPVSGVENLLLSLAYEPFPEPLSLEQLNLGGVYVSNAESVTVWPFDSPFDRSMPLNSEGRSGLYHIRIFGDVEGKQALLVDQVIAAQP